MRSVCTDDIVAIDSSSTELAGLIFLLAFTLSRIFEFYDSFQI